MKSRLALNDWEAWNINAGGVSISKEDDSGSIWANWEQFEDLLELLLRVKKEKDKLNSHQETPSGNIRNVDLANTNDDSKSTNSVPQKAVQNEHIAWCPKCFDALDCVEKIDDNKMISGHFYQCFGCDKTFEIKEFDIGERVFGKNTENEIKDYTSVCKICFKPIKTEPYCWERHIEDYHKDIEDKDSLEDFFMDLDLSDFISNTKKVRYCEVCCGETEHNNKGECEECIILNKLAENTNSALNSQEVNRDLAGSGGKSLSTGLQDSKLQTSPDIHSQNKELLDKDYEEEFDAPGSEEFGGRR